MLGQIQSQLPFQRIVILVYCQIRNSSTTSIVSFIFNHFQQFFSRNGFLISFILNLRQSLLHDPFEMVIQKRKNFSVEMRQLDTTCFLGPQKVSCGFWDVCKVDQNSLSFYSYIKYFGCFSIIKPFLFKLLNILLLASENLGRMFSLLLTSR